MFSPLGIAVLAVVALLTVLFLFIATRPSNFRIERNAVIHAPAHVPFGLINNFHEWEKWSPWDKLDPSIKKTYDGAESGPGARYAWSGNNKAGEGRMTLIDSVPDRSIAIRLEFIKPFAATNQTSFEFSPVDGGTRVNWRMDGTHNFVGKVFALCMNMDKMVGKDFEAGLSNLDAVARQAANS